MSFSMYIYNCGWGDNQQQKANQNPTGDQLILDPV